MKHAKQILSIFAVLTIIAGCATRTGTTTPVSPWEQVMIDNQLIAETNNTIAQGVVNANRTVPPLLQDAQARVILTQQGKIAQVHKQLTLILNNGPSKITLASVNPLIEQIKSSANAMIASGDLGIKDPQSQITIQTSVNTVLMLTQSLLNSLSAAGVK